MSVSARIKELNKRMSQKLTARGVEASETETMTSLINKIDNLPTGQSDMISAALQSGSISAIIITATHLLRN